MVSPMSATSTPAQPLAQPLASTRAERIACSPNWNGSRFVNPQRERMQPAAAIWRWIRGAPDREPTAPLPIQTLEAADFGAPSVAPCAVWLGHSTALIELSGVRVLVDPVWSERCAPTQLFGPRRFHPPPRPLAEVPPIDAVLLTHDHYDHLDQPTVRALAERVPRWICPLGVGGHLERWGVPAERIAEADWWERLELADIEFVCTPARHFSGRGPFDRNRTLWSGWALRSPAGRVWLSGDGGMQPAFADIGERLGPFDLSLVEVGAYDRAWADIHLGPDQAVQAHVAARGGVLLPVHWGTFNLALHPWTEPVERTLTVADSAGVTVAVPRPGERVYAADPGPIAHWWRMRGEGALRAS
jgi:L-ascorbate metabolism protein UlaG (beta-lactamase superfamily)